MYYDSEARGAKPAGERGGEREGERGTGGLPYNPFKALVAPRPIGWITTLTESGSVNLAPYSYFQAVADSPDVVMFSATPAPGGSRSGARKHSELNAVNGGEFVCNLVSYDLRQAMNESSAHLPADVSEAEHAGIELLPSTKVQPPRVASAPAALECIVVDSQPVRHRGGDHRYHMVFGEVVGIHINDEFITDGRVDTAAMQILTRMGYDEYAVLERAFSMPRPDNDPMLTGALRG